MYVSLKGLPARKRSAQRRQRAASGTVILLGLTSLFTDISAEMVTAVLPLFATTALALSPLGYGAIDAIYQGFSAFVRLGSGFVADRSRRPKAVAAAGYGLSALCKLALLPVTSGAVLAAVVAADRTGKGIRTAPRDALIAASSNPERLGAAYGVHRALDTTGALIGPLLAFAILAAIPGGFDTVFLVSFAAALIGVAIIALLVPNLRPRAHADPPTVRSIIRLARRPAVRRLLVVAALLSVLTIGDGFLYLALQRREDFAVAYFPLLFVGTAVVYLVLAVPFGRLADRFGRLRVFLAGHVALLVAYLLANDIVSGPATVLVCLACLGTYYAATDGVLAAATAALVPEDLRGSGLALAQTAVTAGRLVAALAFGAAWTWAGRGNALTVFALALCIAIPVAAATVRGAERGTPA